MIRSMTAFASGECVTRWGTLSCELRSVNHRFLEMSVRMPDELRALEPRIREQLGGRIRRGKLEVNFRLRGLEECAEPSINTAWLEKLGVVANDLVGRFPNLSVEFAGLLKLPGVLQAEGTDTNALQAEAMALLKEVEVAFVEGREREGERLGVVIGERVEKIAAAAAKVRELMPVIREGLEAKLAVRMADLAYPVEAGRMEQELVMWLQKLDVDEELDRLDSHIQEIGQVLKQGEPIGRRLDFLLQEFNREANTLGSKSVDIRSTAASIELKVLIDQIREQIQNIE